METTGALAFCVTLYFHFVGEVKMKAGGSEKLNGEYILFEPRQWKYQGQFKPPLFLCKYWNENLNVWRRWMDILFDPLSWKYAEQCWLWGEKRTVNLSKIWHYMYAETTLDPTYCWKRAMPHIHQWTDDWWAKHQVLLNTLRYFWYFEVLLGTLRYFEVLWGTSGYFEVLLVILRYFWVF